MKFMLAIAQTHSRPGDLEANLQTHLQSARDAAAQSARCVIFPEMSQTGYHLPGGFANVALTREHAFLNPLFEFSTKIDLLFGLAIESADHRIYNASLYLSGRRILAEHRKVYLPTYGAFEEGKHFSRGETFSAFDTDKIRQARLTLPLRRDEDVHLTLRNLTRLARSPDG